MRIAVDFDNTLFKTTAKIYPDFEGPNAKLIEALIDLQKRGHDVILFTCRTGDLLADAQIACHEQGLDFDEIAEGKPHADVYVDDRSMTPDEFLCAYIAETLEERIDEYNKEIEG